MRSRSLDIGQVREKRIQDKSIIVDRTRSCANNECHRDVQLRAGGAKGVGSGGGDGSALPPSLLAMIQDRGRLGAFRGFPLRKKNRITNPPRYFLSI